MSESPDNLLAQLAGHGDASVNPWQAVAPSAPEHRPSDQQESERNLNRMLERINHLIRKNPASYDVAVSEMHGAAGAAASAPAAAIPGCEDDFLPLEPRSLREAGVTEAEMEGLVLKYLLNVGSLTGHEIADQLHMSFILMEPLFRQMKHDQLVVYRDSASMGDYLYQLTDLGRERGRRLSDHCTYFGATPVSLKDYIAGVKAQSITKQHPTSEKLGEAFSDLVLNKSLLDRLGPAVNSGRGLFLYGAPGNGKTSIAERVTRAFGQTVWIPRAIGIDGEIIRVYDPSNHEEMPLDGPEGLYDHRHVDRRWVRIRRPTIIVGGELTMDALEVTLNTSTGISEAPLQLKSNTGVLVIDDFGRQKMRVDELLNRWIVPLEKRVDYLNLPNGKKIQVPFDQLIIFSTNLEPKELVDDAFLRRIPYKIEVPDPTEAEFRLLMRIMSKSLGIEYRDEVVTYLLTRHYQPIGKRLRCCHPRDLLLQIKNMCSYRGLTPSMTPEYFDFAADVYFAVM